MTYKRMHNWSNPKYVDRWFNFWYLCPTSMLDS